LPSFPVYIPVATIALAPDPSASIRMMFFGMPLASWRPRPDGVPEARTAKPKGTEMSGKAHAQSKLVDSSEYAAGQESFATAGQCPEIQDYKAALPSPGTGIRTNVPGQEACLAHAAGEQGGLPWLKSNFHDVIF
jgi:hypothetical protein